MRTKRNPSPGFSEHPEYRVEIERMPTHVRVEFNGETIADSRAVLTVCETRHRPVLYFPIEDVHTDRLSRTTKQTYCPFKGHATHWTVTVGDRDAVNAVWGYEDPYDEVRELKEHVAFYADRVDALYVDEVEQPRVGPGWTDAGADDR